MFHPRGPTFLELARQGLSSTRRGYDLLAPKFDYTPFRTPDAVLDVVAEALSADAPFDDGLDLCCGTGAATKRLRSLCRRRVVGLDFSEGMLAEARRQLGEEGPTPVELVRGDVLELGYRAEFDLVTCFGAFGHILRRDEARFVAGIRRALRPGGSFVFVTVRKPRPLSPAWTLGHGYNALAHLRNLLLRPPFVMFYLTFTLEDASPLLERNGFQISVKDGGFPQPYGRLVLVEAKLPQ